jgi:hypothetical protein
MSMTTRSSMNSYKAAIGFGAIAGAILPSANLPTPQSLADYGVAICAKALHPASGLEASSSADNLSAMTKMLINMVIRRTEDVDGDFVAMMVPHQRDAIELAQTEPRYGRDDLLRRLGQEIIVTQQQEIVAMRLALGQPLPAPAPDKVPPAKQNNRIPAVLRPEQGSVI